MRKGSSTYALMLSSLQRYASNKTSNQSYTGEVARDKDDDTNLYGLWTYQLYADSDWIFHTGSCHTFHIHKTKTLLYGSLDNPTYVLCCCHWRFLVLALSNFELKSLK